MLEIPRQEILKFLKQKKIEYRTDRTNLELNILRNRIRNKLLPRLLKEYNPNLIQLLGKTAAVLSESEEFIDEKLRSQAKQILTRADEQTLYLDLKRLKKLPVIMQRNLVRLTWKSLTEDTYPLDFDQVERVLDLTHSGKTGQRVNLKRGYWAEKGQYRLVLFRPEPNKLKVRIPVNGEAVIPTFNLRIHSRVLDREQLPEKIFSCTEQKAYLDYQKFTSPPLLRNWQAGDRFKPLGMKGVKKLSDFFTDRKITRHLRSRIPVLCSNGRIAWLVGQRISEDFKVTSQSTKVLFLTAEQLKECQESAE